MVIRDLAENKDVQINFDFCVGADGSYSVVRRQLMRVVRFVRCMSSDKLFVSHGSHRMDFHQEYIPHEYLELKVPPGTDGDGHPTFLLDPNHLHIWPRHSFMLIALPNKVRKHRISVTAIPYLSPFSQDKSFTCTLFAPTAEFERLHSREAILAWFAEQFPDALSFIGAEAIADAFAKNPLSPLISTKVFISPRVYPSSSFPARPADSPLPV